MATDELKEIGWKLNTTFLKRNMLIVVSLLGITLPVTIPLLIKNSKEMRRLYRERKRLRKV